MTTENDAKSFETIGRLNYFGQDYFAANNGNADDYDIRDGEEQEEALDGASRAVNTVLNDSAFRSLNYQHDPRDAYVRNQANDDPRESNEKFSDCNIIDEAPAKTHDDILVDIEKLLDKQTLYKSLFLKIMAMCRDEVAREEIEQVVSQSETLRYATRNAASLVDSLITNCALQQTVIADGVRMSTEEYMKSLECVPSQPLENDCATNEYDNAMAPVVQCDAVRGQGFPESQNATDASSLEHAEISRYDSVVFVLQLSVEGAEVLANNSPALLLENLISQHEQYREVYSEMLRFCAQPKSLGEVQSKIRELGFEITPNRENKKYVYPLFILEGLQAAGLLEWHDGWTITPEGNCAIEEQTVAENSGMNLQ